MMKDEAARIIKVATGTTTTVGLTIANIQAYVAIAVGLVTFVYTCVLIYVKVSEYLWQRKVRQKELEVLESQK